MLKFSSFIMAQLSMLLQSFEEENNEVPIEQDRQNTLFGTNDYVPFHEGDTFNESYIVESVEDHPDNPARLVFRGSGTTAKGIVVPRHMWEGSKPTDPNAPVKMGKNGKPKKQNPTMGMRDRNKLRAQVYGGENRDPLTLAQIENVHKQTLDEHFAKPKSEQIESEKAAVARLQAAGHLGKNGDTTDEGEKTDTVQNEYDEKGRSFVASAAKGVAGHALYTSGHGENERHHILNTCPAQTEGCGGGVDAHGVADTSKGGCFAPNAEAQYVAASVKRACHEQAKHDPAMTRDWILAHAHSLRNRADEADKQDKRTLFRPNVVDETDRSSRHLINHLNAQRATEANPSRPDESKPPIVANSYGKTDELHDPENNYHVTYSNTGPKVKNGGFIHGNMRKDRQRIRNTISATQGASGKDIVNDQGNKTPPKGSYLVTSMRRGSALDKAYQANITHIKYWSGPRREHEISDSERAEGPEGHYDGNGNATTPDKAHYGHKTINGRRYDYQKQHVLHPRLVPVGDKVIPTDSRFKDEEFLPKERFKSKNGKTAGGILVTTPTTSTSKLKHESEFNHHVGPETIEHAKMNNGEHEIDKPEDQEAARDKPFVNPSMETAVKSAKSKSDKVRQEVGRPMTGIERAIARAKDQQID